MRYSTKYSFYQAGNTKLGDLQIIAQVQISYVTLCSLETLETCI